MTDWVEQQVDHFRRLTGQAVSGWSATEMAIRESGVGGAPEFEDPTVPFLQLEVLHLEMDDGSVVSVQTYQDDGGTFGLFPRVPETALVAGDDGIYRTRRLDGLAVGAVLDVSVGMSEFGTIRSVQLSFDGADPVALVAGEVYEELDDSLRFCMDDESVLLFRRASDFETVDWWRPSN